MCYNSTCKLHGGQYNALIKNLTMENTMQIQLCHFKAKWILTRNGYNWYEKLNVILESKTTENDHKERTLQPHLSGEHICPLKAHSRIRSSATEPRFYLASMGRAAIASMNVCVLTKGSV